MPSRLSAVRGEPLLEIASYGRRGPASKVHLTPAQIERIARTVARAPEVMVKVSGGAKSVQAASAHLRYIDRNGRFEIETDQGEALQGKGAERQLLADWDLDILKAEARSPYRGVPGRPPAKILHNIVLSMPSGTSPEKLLAASRAFAREQFALKHRYAMVLHTDQDHPHVHLVIKAVSEEGERLNIRKATLREWRRQFARQLREQGVAANATERAVRGVTKPQKKDGIYRADRRHASTHWRQRTEAVSRAMTPGGEIKPEAAKAQLLETRLHVLRGWNGVADDLARQGEAELALEVRRFVTELPPPRTEREWIRDRLLEQSRGSERAQFDRWTRDALATWQAFRAQQQAAEQARRRDLDRAGQMDLEPLRIRERNQGRTR